MVKKLWNRIFKKKEPPRQNTYVDLWNEKPSTLPPGSLELETLLEALATYESPHPFVGGFSGYGGGESGGGGASSDYGSSSDSGSSSSDSGSCGGDSGSSDCGGGGSDF